MRSTRPSVRKQPLSDVPLVAPHYLITSGAQLVDVVSTLIFAEQAALDYVRHKRDDVAIWHITPDDPPRICAIVRPLLNGAVALQAV